MGETRSDQRGYTYIPEGIDSVREQELTSTIEALRAKAAFFDGHWTREPAEVEGFYLLEYSVDAPGGGRYGICHMRPGEYAACPVRWSVPLPAMPPVPED